MPDYHLTRLRGELAITFIDSGGKRRRHTTGTADPVEASRILADFFAKSARPAAQNIEGLINAYLDHLGSRAWGGTAKHQAKAVIRAFGSLVPMQITERVVSDYVAQRRELGRAQQTIRNEVSLLSSALNHGINKRLISERPHIAFPQGSPPKDRSITRDQFRQILDKCPTLHIRLFMVLAIATAGRMTAITDLTWDRVDFTRGLIDLKTNVFARMKGRAVAPMNAMARAELERAYQMRLSNFVIEHGGQQVAKPSKGVKEAGKRIGIDWLSPHVFRHSAARWMAEDGVPMTEIAAYLGHRDSAITERVYARFSPDYLRKAAKSLDF